MPVLFVKFNFCSTMKKLIILASTIVLTASAATVAYVYSQKSSSDLFEANVEALTEGESIGDYVQNFLGCRGGSKKCFEGTISIKGVSVSGTWFKS